MKIEMEEPIARLFAWFQKTGRPLYIVGGAVRNKLLSLPVSDIDAAAAVPPQKVKEIEDGAFHVTERSYGLGTVVIVSGPHSYEYTAFRRDSYGRGGAHRPQGVTLTEDIVEDAARRDFTVNALYMGAGGEVLDPLERGLSDLAARRLAMTRPDTLCEDALRILRMARLAAELGFSIEPDTMRAAKENAAGLRDISGERIRDEFFKLLLADVKYGNKDGALIGLHILKEAGALPYIMPELLEGKGFVQSAQYHRYDVLEHNLRTCAAAPPDIAIRLAALLHDVAKPAAYKRDGTLYVHPKLGAQMAETILKRLKTETKLAQTVLPLIEWHMFDLDNSAKEKAVARMIVKLGRENFLRLAALRDADFTGSGMGNIAHSAQKWRAVLASKEAARAPLALKQLAVNGDDIQKALSLAPGRQVGELLRRLQEYAIKKPAQNNYTSLIRYARILYTGMADREDAGE